MSVVLLALLAAAPKDCGKSLSCMGNEVKTCGPARYSQTEKEETEFPYMKPSLRWVTKTTTRTHWTVAPSGPNVCSFELDVSIETVESEPSRGTEISRVVVPEPSPLAHLRCERTPEQLRVMLLGGHPAGAPSCYPVSCPPVTARVAEGCAWTGCEQGTPRLVCGKRTCTYENGMPCKFGKEVAGCFLWTLLSPAADCLASCPRDGTRAKISCEVGSR